MNWIGYPILLWHQEHRFKAMLIMSVLLNGWPTFVDPRTSVEAGCFRLNLSNDPPAPSEHPRDQTEESEDWIVLIYKCECYQLSFVYCQMYFIWFSVSVVCCSAFKVPHLQSYILVFSVCLAPTHRLQNLTFAKCWRKVVLPQPMFPSTSTVNGLLFDIAIVYLSISANN